MRSLSSGERGLKYCDVVLCCYHHSRSLQESVDWNELGYLRWWFTFRRSLQESVDWNSCSIVFLNSTIWVALFRRAWIEILPHHLINRKPYCRSLQESVDWNFLSLCQAVIMIVALFRRAWIEIFWRFFEWFITSSRSLQESVDWNIYIKSFPKTGSHVALFRRAWIEILLCLLYQTLGGVALFRRAWIEM